MADGYQYNGIPSTVQYRGRHARDPEHRIEAGKAVTIPPYDQALTGAELRLLPLLTTHLTFAEIATKLFLSKATIKSQAYSLYRKLGATSRSEAVIRSRGLGLLGE